MLSSSVKINLIDLKVDKTFTLLIENRSNNYECFDKYPR
jgi:hypothetical protein